MTLGLRIRDPNGNITIDITDRITRSLGTVSTNGVTGRVDDARFGTGQGWYHVVMPGLVNSNQVLPVINVDTGGISWTYSPSAQQKALAVTIIYGVF